ncbi:hypothetical protein [Burkholderia sp. Ac-20365]|uniref:hypothetical protein n=1 Tax=Burkholderia sp. Ac-20365 TaxID=2703897 RepID=UPI00197BA45C|nr:hypothetical protein [Burkholderia sp. Ac-20365]MBN3761262.1 hypothetical protein [Burkholderia sp. Ac-20365]
MKKMLAVAIAVVCTCAHAQSNGAAQTVNFVAAGAGDLRPSAVFRENGHLHLQFDSSAVPSLPVALALRNDGYLTPVNFNVVPREKGSTEYVILDPTPSVVLKLGDREAVVVAY